MKIRKNGENVSNRALAADIKRRQAWRRTRTALVILGVTCGLLVPAEAGAITPTCGATCDQQFDATGRWKALGDPDTPFRVVCAHWRLKVTVNDTAHTLPNFDVESKNRTYQGAYPVCGSNLPQAAGAMHARAYGYLNDGGYFYRYIVTPLASNGVLDSTALSRLSLDRGAPDGFYYFYGTYDWTAFGSYHHYQGPSTPTFAYCRSDRHSC